MKGTMPPGLRRGKTFKVRKLEGHFRTATRGMCALSALGGSKAKGVLVELKLSVHLAWVVIAILHPECNNIMVFASNHSLSCTSKPRRTSSGSISTSTQTQRNLERTLDSSTKDGGAICRSRRSQQSTQGYRVACPVQDARLFFSETPNTWHLQRHLL